MACACHIILGDMTWHVVSHAHIKLIAVDVGSIIDFVTPDAVLFCELYPHPDMTALRGQWESLVTFHVG